MDSDDDSKMNKAERLALAGAIAPYLREQATAASQRRVARVDKNGKVVGYTTLAKVQEALLEKHKIEIAVQPDETPKEIMCVDCGLPAKVKKTGTRRKRCDRCARGKCTVCKEPFSDRIKGAGYKQKYCKKCLLEKRAKERFVYRCTECSVEPELGKRGRCSACARKIMHCSRCGGAGHNKVSCKAEIGALKTVCCMDCGAPLKCRKSERCKSCSAKRTNRLRQKASS